MPEAPSAMSTAKPEADASDAPELDTFAAPPPPPPRQRSFRELRSIYILIVLAVIASHALPFPPAPRRAPAPGRGARSLDDLLHDARGMPLAAQALALVPLIAGGGLLLGYIILRAHNVRVFPRCRFAPATWDNWHLVRALAAFTVMQRLVHAWFGWLQWMGWNQAVPEAIQAAGGAAAIMGGTTLFVVVLLGGEGRNAFRLLGLAERRVPSRVAIGISAMLMAVPVIWLVGLFTILLTGKVPARQPLIESASHLSTEGFLVVAVIAVVVAPITEEILFRGLIYPTLRRYLGPLGAISVSAGAFAVLHVHLPTLAPLFVIGFVLAYLYERTGSLTASIAAHAANNLHTMLLVYLLSRGGV